MARGCTEQNQSICLGTTKYKIRRSIEKPKDIVVAAVELLINALGQTVCHSQYWSLVICVLINLLFEEHVELLEEKGRFCLPNYIFRSLSCAELYAEGTLHNLWATHHPKVEM